MPWIVAQPRWFPSCTKPLPDFHFLPIPSLLAFGKGESTTSISYVLPLIIASFANLHLASIRVRSLLRVPFSIASTLYVRHPPPTMCFPRLAGGVEIEERYPRTNDPREPRRKRLNFVRSSSRSRRNSSASDDYALVRSSFHNARPIRAEMRERHDPRILQQQEQAIRQLHGQNQHMQHQLQLQEQMRRQHEIEPAHHPQQHMLQHGQAHPYPPPPPFGPHPQEQHRLHGHPHPNAFPPGIEPVHQEEFHPQANYEEIAPRPRSRMPAHMQHGGRSLSRGRAHRRHHSGTSIYSDDRDSYPDMRRRHRSPVFYGSSHNSFDDLIAPRRRR